MPDRSFVRRLAPALLLLLPMPPTPAQAQSEPETKAIRLTPRAEPRPALKYRLLPLDSELNPGDAAPIYLRLSHALPSEALKSIDDKFDAWMSLPLEEFPVAEARDYVNNNWSNKLKQIHFAARRQECRWEFTLPEEREHSIEILLPDTQQLRTWVRLVALKARVQVAEGDYDGAITTIQTGMAFSRHLAEGPFLINRLVGTASALVMLERLEELMSRPDAPSLYWALATVPDPPIAYRGGFASEEKVVDWMVPELTGLDDVRTEAEWASRLARLHGRLKDLEEILSQADPEKYRYHLRGTTAESFKSGLLPEARKHLEARRGSIKGLTDDQLVVLYVASRVDDFNDDLFKLTYLPFALARPLYPKFESDPRFKELRDGPLAFVAELLPSLSKGHEAEARLSRKVAALQTIEAIRIHAADHKGRLPESLDALTSNPAPPDPFTGKPFEYRLDGDTAIFSGPSLGLEKEGFVYRITVGE